MAHLHGRNVLHADLKVCGGAAGEFEVVGSGLSGFLVAQPLARLLRSCNRDPLQGPSSKRAHPAPPPPPGAQHHAQVQWRRGARLQRQGGAAQPDAVSPARPGTAPSAPGVLYLLPPAERCTSRELQPLTPPLNPCAQVADFGLSVKMDHLETHLSNTFQGGRQGEPCRAMRARRVIWGGAAVRTRLRTQAATCTAPPRPMRITSRVDMRDLTSPPAPRHHDAHEPRDHDEGPPVKGGGRLRVRDTALGAAHRGCARPRLPPALSAHGSLPRPRCSPLPGTPAGAAFLPGAHSAHTRGPGARRSGPAHPASTHTPPPPPHRPTATKERALPLHPHPRPPPRPRVPQGAQGAAGPPHHGPQQAARVPGRRAAGLRGAGRALLGPAAQPQVGRRAPRAPPRAPRGLGMPSAWRRHPCARAE